MKKSLYNPNIFLRAMEELQYNDKGSCSFHCCSSIIEAAGWDKKERWDIFLKSLPEYNLFASLFRQSVGKYDFWWPMFDGGVRIIALQLAYEVAKELNKAAKRK